MNQMRINLRLKQQRYKTNRSKIRRVRLPKKQSIVLSIERGKTVEYRDKSFDEIRLMIVDPPPKRDI